MRPLALIYWLRVVLGVVAAVISTAITIAGGERGLNTFLNGLTMALVVYLVSFYIIKARFVNKVEKQSKIMTQGIGIYFFTWLVSWVLTYTLILGQP